jgi:MATE family, multidrug efflux pump
MQDLTTGSVSRHLLKTTSFMLVTMVFQTFYYLVDLYWVGHLGKESVAAVGLAGNLMFIVLAISQMLGVGTTTLIAHAAGRKEHERASLVFNQSIVLSIVVGVLFTAIALATRLSYARGLSADAATAEQTAVYLAWFLPALGLQFVMVAMSAALRGTGNFKPGMVVQTSTIVINMVLAPVLIFGWITQRPMGVAGAAVATLVAIVVGTLWLSWYFVGEHAYLKFVAAEWRPRFDLWRQMLGIGLPAGAEFGLIAVYLVIVYAITRPFGAAAQAGFGIGMRVVQSLFMPVVALGFSVAPVAGQNFGAKLGDRVRETMWSAMRMAVGLMIVVALACHFAAAALIRIFTSDPQVVAVGEEYLRIVALTFVPSGVIFVASSMFQAIGNTIPSLAASFVRILLVGGPAFILSGLPGFQLRSIWYLSVTAVAVQMGLSLLLLRRELQVRLPGGRAIQPTSVHTVRT